MPRRPSERPHAFRSCCPSYARVLLHLKHAACWCSVQGSPEKWQTLYADKYPVTDITIAAAKLAGGWKALYQSKHQTDKAAHPWHKPSPFEVKAQISEMCSCGRTDTCMMFLIDGSGSMNPGARHADKGSFNNAWPACIGLHVVQLRPVFLQGTFAP